MAAETPSHALVVGSDSVGDVPVSAGVAVSTDFEHASTSTIPSIRPPDHAS
jgi:hypothetical protein